MRHQWSRKPLSRYLEGHRADLGMEREQLTLFAVQQSGSPRLTSIHDRRKSMYEIEG